MRLLVAATAIFSVIILSACTDNNQHDTQAELTNPTDKLSYTIGVDLGSNFQNEGIDVNANLIKQGIDDVLQGRELRLTQDEMDETLSQFQQAILERRAQQMGEMAEENQQAGERFLTETRGREGVQELPSGMLYEVITQGTGPQPTVNDTVSVIYEGSLIDGTIIDSSQGESVTLPINELIPGWQEALTNMSEGSIWKIYLPPQLAYGEQGAGMIGPNQVLVFEIHLLSVLDNNQNGNSADDSTTEDSTVDSSAPTGNMSSPNSQ